jgi:protein TonB
MNNNPAISLSSPTGSTLCYHGVTQPTGAFWLAVLVALALNAALLWGFPGHPFVDRGAPPKPNIKIVEWPIPPDDPPEPKPRELSKEPPAVRVPALTDAPRLVSIDTPFVQKAEPVVPLDKTGLTGAVVSIPISYRRGPTEGDGSIRIFDAVRVGSGAGTGLPSFTRYPFELIRSGLGGTVRASFIVDSHGNVVALHVLSSTNPGFERATVEALAKWKFRPGMKKGRKVNTRMEQPIEFNVPP